MRVTTVHVHSRVGLLVPGPAPRVATDTPLGITAELMSENNVSAVLVGVGAEGVAIVTEQDLTRAWARGYSAQSPVSEIATPSPIVVSADSEILEAAALMLNEGVRHLVVARPEGSPGILSVRPVMAVLLQAATPDLWLTRLRWSIA